MAGSSHDDYCLQEYKYLFQKDLLRGKVAFITGGASGIGFRIAELFMRHGCSTVIASRRMEKLQQVLAGSCWLCTCHSMHIPACTYLHAHTITISMRLVAMTSWQRFILQLLLGKMMLCNSSIELAARALKQTIQTRPHCNHTHFTTRITIATKLYRIANLSAPT